MKIFFSCILLIFIGLAAQGQPSTAHDSSAEIFAVVEVSPEFPGGVSAMYAFINKRIKYPNEALENGIEGKVVAQFVINKEGYLTNIKILKDPGYGMGNEVVRVLNLMPQWSPGIQKGNPVNVQYNLPVAFTLDEDQKVGKQKKKKSKSKSSPTDKF